MLIARSGLALVVGIIGLTMSVACTAAEDCAGLGEPTTKSDLLHGRLSILVPNGAAGVANRPNNIMGPSEDESDRSVVSVTRNGANLRVVSSELFARRGELADTRLVAAAAQFIGLTADEVAPSDITPDASLKWVAIEPRAPHRISSATTVFAALVEDADGFLTFVGISLDLADQPSTACPGLIRAMAASITPGTRRLESEAGWRRVDRFEIRVPSGWLARRQRGPDFAVWYLFKAPVLGESSSSIGIYDGFAPSFHPQGKPIVSGKILGRKAPWYPRASGDPAMDTRVDLEHQEVLHIWVVPAATEDAATLRAMAESLRSAGGT